MKTSTDKRPTFISLFAGCGGSSLGYKMAGFREIAAVEWWHVACETLRRNFVGISVIEGDVREKLEEVRNLLGGRDLDVLDGSPPCQGFSISNARKRSKHIINDPRNDLVFEFIRWVRELRPKTFVMENVRGMRLGPMIIKFNAIFREMQDLDYDVQAREMEFHRLGVPQKRNRIVFVGVRKDIGRKYEYPKPFSEELDFIKMLDGLKLDKREEEFLMDAEGKVNREMWFGKFSPKISHFTFQKIIPGKACPTLTVFAGNFGLCTNSYHHKQPRRLAVPEMKLASTFPADFKFYGEDYYLMQKKLGKRFYAEIMKQIGNCVPPLGVQKIAEKLLEVLR
jgi:DNA (cytosine-5)-methyltransferase 1